MQGVFFSRDGIRIKKGLCNKVSVINTDPDGAIILLTITIFELYALGGFLIGLYQMIYIILSMQECDSFGRQIEMPVVRPKRKKGVEQISKVDMKLYRN